VRDPRPVGGSARATKRIVAALRAGQSGAETAAWGAALRKGVAAQERIAAFTARKRPGRGKRGAAWRRRKET
jgi:hypothetical protein